MNAFDCLQKVVRSADAGEAPSPIMQLGDKETPPKQSTRMPKKVNARRMRKDFEENFNNWVVECGTEFNLWCRPPLKAGKQEEI